MSNCPPSASKTSQWKFTPTSKSANFLQPTCSSAAKRTPKQAPKMENTFCASNTALQPDTFLNMTCFDLVDMVPVIDWEEKCDDAYNENLQALLKRQIMQQCVMKDREELSVQLAAQCEELFKDKLELQRLEFQIAKRELRNEVTRTVEELKAEFEEFSKTCEEGDLENQLNLIIDILCNIKDRVNFKNIAPPKTQEECERLKIILQRNNVLLEKFRKTTPSEEKLEQLATNMQNILRLQDEIKNKGLHLEEMQINTLLMIFKGLSDFFAVIKGIQ